MYAALWHRLPGPVWLRVLLAVLMAAAIVVALFGWGFPALDALLFPTNEVVTSPG